MASSNITGLTNLATPQPTMLMYAGLSPFGATDDRKITANALLSTITQNISDISLQFDNGLGTATVSAAGKGKIRYNNTTKTFQYSADGGAYADLGQSPGAPAFSIQFNNGANVFAGDAAFLWDTVTATVTIGDSSVIDGHILLRNATNTNTLTIQPGATGSNLTWTLPINNGTGGQFLQNNAGVLSWATAATSPGGSPSQIQYNAAGSLGGAAGFDFDPTATWAVSLKPVAAQMGQLIFEDGSTPPVSLAGSPALLHLHAGGSSYWALGYSRDGVLGSWANWVNSDGALTFETDIGATGEFYLYPEGLAFFSASPTYYGLLYESGNDQYSLGLTINTPTSGQFPVLTWTDTNVRLGTPGARTISLTLSSSGSANASTIQAGDTPASSVVYKWPADNPAAGEQLTVTSFAGGTAVLEWAAAGGAPAGAGSELQYRSSATAFGAVTGSSVSGGAVTLGDNLTIAENVAGIAGMTVTNNSSSGSAFTGLTLTGNAKSFGLYTTSSGNGSAPNSLIFTDGGTGRARLDTNGNWTFNNNVAIGNASPISTVQLVVNTTSTANVGARISGGANANTIELQNNGANVWVLDKDGSLAQTPKVRTATSVSYMQIITPADTSLTASTESIGIQHGGNASAATVTRQFATGALTTQREYAFVHPTYAFIGASVLTTAATVAITNAPAAGANATITNSYALWIQAGNSLFNGLVGFNNQAPQAPVDVLCVNTTNEGVRIRSNSGAVVADFYSDGTDFFIGTSSNHQVSLYANATDMIRFTDLTLGFFGVTPVVQQTFGAATAGAVYGSTEQTMLQTLWDAFRAYGLGT
jgi:hypothetical protein